MRTRVLSVAALAIVVAPLVASPTAAGPASDQLVRHGQGIGKLRLGMTIAEVKRILGAPRAQNKREKRPRGYVYIEQDWDYGWWTVGFLRAPRGEYRAVSIGTVQRSQRTPEGLGVGSRKEELARRLEELRCWEVQSLPMTFGGFTNECVYGERAGRSTAFILDKPGGFFNPYKGVVQVEVRAPGFYRGRRVRLCPLEASC
jgi:hypothetical protein